MSGSAVQQQGNLPATPTSFVGRRNEIAEVQRALSCTRLVTLAGVGGVGKTRLAIRVAGRVARTYPDSAWLVELAGLSDPASLSQTVTAALRIPDLSGRSPRDVLIDYLADKHLLLVLDNCEHLVDACAELADTLLSKCPKLCILATSRQALGIGAEYVRQLPSLPVPEADQQPLSANNLQRYEAVQLFVERAEAVMPEFALSPDNCESVAHLCRYLEGLPLAIEMAAVRLRHLGLQQINDRLGDRYRLLTGGSRVALPRHQTLQALIDWSYDLCSPRERTLWAYLSVFSGDFELAAVEQVCSGDGIPRESIFDLLTGLIDKSIVARDAQGADTRYRMLETIRQYGAGRLAESGENAALHRRHRDWYLGLVKNTEADWFGPQQMDLFARLRRDHANIRAALDFCVTEPDETESGLRVASAMRTYWHSTGFMEEGRRWLDQALRQETRPTVARAKALWVDSWLAVLQRDLDTATSRLAECVALAEHLGDEALTAQVTLAAGVVANHRGDKQSAVTHFEDAVSRHRSTGNLTGLAISLYLVGLTSTIVGDTARAITVSEECRALCAAHGERWYQSHALWVQGIAVWQQGDTLRATNLEKESIRLKPALYDRLGTAHCIEALAWFAETDGKHDRSARLLGAAQSVRKTIGVTISAHLADYHNRAETGVRQALGEAAFRKAFDNGLGLTLDQAVATALDKKVGKSTEAGRGKASTGLTSREKEVARLVTEGLSNKGIAERLVVSRRTAEAHVEHILVKLGFTARTQIATWHTEDNDEPTPPGR